MHSCPLSHIYEQRFVKATFSKFMISRVKNTFEPNVIKCVIKTIFINSSHFALLLINIKIFFNFQKEWCTFRLKKRCLKKTKIVHSQGLNVLNM